MKAKKQIINRVLSFVLSLVMVVGLLPHFALEAEAVTSASTTFSVDGLTYTATLIRFSTAGGLDLSDVTSISSSSPSREGNEVKVKITFYGNSNTFPCTFGYTFSDSNCQEALQKEIHYDNYIVSNPTLIQCKITRAAADHTDGTAICTQRASCERCGKLYGEVDLVNGHSYTYTANGSVLTEKCDNGCGHTAKVTLTTPQQSYTYTGKFINPAVLEFDENWQGSKGDGLIYENSEDVGTATVTAKIEGKIISTTFEIKAADLSGATITLDPPDEKYTGNNRAPHTTVTYDGIGTLVEGADYTISWNVNGTVNAGTYTVTVKGKGNFKGEKTAQYTIHPVDIASAVVNLDRNTFVYDGQPHKPTVIVMREGNILTEGVDYDLYYMSSDQVLLMENGEPTRFFGYTSSDCINAGKYYAVAVGKGNYAANSSFAYAAYIIDKAIVTEPSIDSKTYDNTVQTADITDTELYTVVKNDGGENAGNYDVVLKLKDSTNYAWANSYNEEVTLQFKITQAKNSWVEAPSISGWTYGKSANAPTGEAKFGAIEVLYSGTANDQTTYNGNTPPTKAGSYVAQLFVNGTENYEPISDSVTFTIAKANYNMNGAKWEYTAPFQYDGKEHKVEVVGLPAGVTVESYENNTAIAVGDYYAKANLSYDANNYNKPTINLLGWTIYNDWTPTEYTISAPNGNGWQNNDFVITAADGYKVSLTNTADGTWEDALTYSGETADSAVTFYLKNEADGTISLAKTVNYKIDKTPATGKVEFVNRKAWQEFVNTITFGLVYNEEVTVKAEASDALSGVDKIEYVCFDKAMPLEQIKEIANWEQYSESFGVTLEDAKRFVYFVRITDKAGNQTYLSTDGAEYDTTPPVIEGVENGETYYTTQRFTVKESNLESVTVNGNPSMTLTLGGNVDKEYVIVATDMAGNTTTVTVKMKPIKELAKATENLGNDNVTSDDVPALKELIEKLDELIADPDTSDDGEKETLEQHKVIAESLLKTIEDAAKVTDTDNTEKVKDVTSENVTPENKTDLEKAKADLEKALDENGDNYTEDQKKAIEGEIKRIDDALAVIGNVEAVEKLIGKLPKEITKADEDVVLAAKNAFAALTDYEKTLVLAEYKEALDNAVAALAKLDAPADTESPNTGDSSTVWVLFALLIASGAGALGITTRRKKKISK